MIFLTKAPYPLMLRFGLRFQKKYATTKKWNTSEALLIAIRLSVRRSLELDALDTTAVPDCQEKNDRRQGIPKIVAT